VSCLLGARLAGYPEAYVQAVRRSGWQLGIAYQIFDDVADFCGDEGKIGKTLGTTWRAGSSRCRCCGCWSGCRMRKCRRCGRRCWRARRTCRTGGADDAARVFCGVRERFEAELRAGEDGLAKLGSARADARLLGLASFVRMQLARVAG